MDETTDVTVNKQLAIMVEFYDIDKSKTIVELLDLVQCDDGKAETLLKNLVSLLKQINIPPERYTFFVLEPSVLSLYYISIQSLLDSLVFLLTHATRCLGKITL